MAGNLEIWLINTILYLIIYYIYSKNINIYKKINNTYVLNQKTIEFAASKSDGFL